MKRSPGSNRKTLRKCASSSPTTVPCWPSILSLGRKKRAITLLSSSQQQRHPFFFPFLSDNSKTRGKLFYDLFSFLIQNAGEDQKSPGSHSFLQRHHLIDDRFCGQIRHHHGKSRFDPA